MHTLALVSSFLVIFCFGFWCGSRVERAVSESLRVDPDEDDGAHPSFDRDGK